MNSDTKSKRYFDDKKVFPLSKSTTYELWGVEADTGIYKVRYDIVKELYFCTCKNVRLTHCSHIKAVILKKNENA